MKKIALVADSTCDLNKEEIEKYNVHILPLKIVYKDREYTDRVDITPQEIYDNMKIEVPTTSLPSMEEVDSLFSKLKEEGYTHVIAVTISSGLSGTHNTIRVVSEKHPEMTYEIFDSKALSMGAGGIILECGEMINEGKEFDYIIKQLPILREKIKVYYVLDTLKYLMKGGRIGKVSGSIGELLNLKPIISIDNEGIYYTYTKVRGKKKSVNKLYEIMKETLEGKTGKVWVLHGGAKEEAQKLYKKAKNIPNAIREGYRDISPVAGVHTGPGLVGITIMKK